MLKSIVLSNKGLLIYSAAGAASVLATTCFVLRHQRKLLELSKLELKLPKIALISNINEWTDISGEFLSSCQKRKVVGLDCEWVTERSSGSRRPIAILQLATAHDICLLIRLNKFGKDFPDELKSFLENRRILKVGVAINDDAKKLFLDYGLQVRGCLDLRHIVDKIPRYAQLTSKGLQGLARVMLGSEIDKSFTVRCSNWEDDELSERQIKYASEDVVAAALIFKHLMTYYKLHWWSWRLPTDDELHTAAFQLCGNQLDCNYSQKIKSKSPSNTNSSPFVKFGGQSTKAYSTRSKPLYHNCQLQAPDGEPLCTCDNKKAQWYLDRDLGTMLSEDPLIVRLKFEPSGRPILDNKYYTREKENKCVVCGETERTLRKTVVPHEYRKYFPPLMKDHLSHDILLLCVDCHIRSNGYDAILRHELAQECNAPIGARDDVKCREDPRLKKVKSAGRALLKARDQLPNDRAKELEAIVREYYNVGEEEPLTLEIIEKASKTEPVYELDGYIPHGKKVVEVQQCSKGLMAFERRWRKHFLDCMKPKYLPEMWSVNHNHERLVLQVTKGSSNDFDPSILGNVSQ